MPAAVLDASAVLALLLGEPGADRVRARRAGAVVSAVTYAEVVGRAARLCGSAVEAARRVGRQEFAVTPFDRPQAEAAAAIHARTRHLGLSLGDCTCLALGQTLGRPVVTADRDWLRVEGVGPVEVIR